MSATVAKAPLLEVAELYKWFPVRTGLLASSWSVRAWSCSIS